jgi:hypothetical protein
MTTSESINEIAAALSTAQGDIEHATKDAKNPHFNSKYATLAAVADACKDPMKKAGLSVFQSPAADGNLVRMTTRLLHKSGQWIESDVLQVQARDASPQAVGSALTYLRRYQLAAVMGVAPDDDDAEAAQPRMAPVAQRDVVKDAKTAAESVARGFERGLKAQQKPPMPEPPPLSDKDIPFMWLLAVVLPALGLFS